jgi:predicted peroxiredoxin
MKIKQIFIMALIMTALFVSFTTAQEKESQKIVVHLSHFGDNLHAVNMALKLATVAKKSGMGVTLFVDLEGVRLADKRQPQNLTWGKGDSVADLYRAYLEAGGKILVCPHCAKAAGLVSQNLRNGASIATEDGLAKMLLKADKILDY